jgi:adenosylhomocysteine nucleosidase
MSEPPPKIGIVAALEMEGRWLGDSSGNRLILVGGMGRERAEAAARQLLESGATALVSWGVAGGLDPALASGTVVLADQVLCSDGSVRESHPRWRTELRSLIETRVHTVVAPLFHSEQLVSSVTQKGRLRDRWRASAVDMESDGVGRVADSAGVPWLAVRAVTDTATFEVPEVAVSVCGENGRLRPGAVAGLVLRPWLWHTLTRLAGATRAAARSMRRLDSIAGPDFALGDIDR